jgi:hypothetical protein
MSQEEKPVEFDRDTLEAMNAKAVENQFFTPDHVYVDLALMKDFNLGAIYADIIAHRTEEHFNAFQAGFVDSGIINEYQKRRYDTINPYLEKLGYTDQRIAELLDGILNHDEVFMIAPTTKFFNLLIRHTIRNQNHSGPANKFVKTKLNTDQYSLDAIPVTYYLNTYPLTLSTGLMNQLAPELGEAFGVNIKFINKNPHEINHNDWDQWFNKIECMYLNSLGQFTGGDYILKKMGDMQLTGVYVFARKRFETDKMAVMAHHDFEQQIQIVMAQISMLCDFDWLQNSDTRLTEEAEDVPADPSDEAPEDGTTS